MYNTPLDLIRDKLKGESILFRGLEPTMLVHLALQRRYILEQDPKLRQKVMIELMGIDCRTEGFFIGAGIPQYIQEWRNIVDFGLGHTKEDLDKWEEQFKEWQ